MVAYQRDEIVSASDMTRSFSNVLGSIIDNEKEKIAISKNNKLEAVLINIEEYEKLKDVYELYEYMELNKLIQDRKDSKTISLEEAMKNHGISEDDL
jgi:PHD/YefM family antitoxin component YafN of YafNO toxin-antitoxin module